MNRPHLAFLTRPWLEERTLPQTMERGVSYYQKGRIISVKERDLVIEGQVQGSAKYIQTIGLDEAGEPVATCNCPYSASGFCKHIVAVAMAVIDGHVEQIAEREDMQLVSDQDFFEREFKATPAGMQEAFLMQAFARRPEWRDAFLRYQNTPAEQHLVDIRDFREKLRDTLLLMEINPGEVESQSGPKSLASEVAENILRRSLVQRFKPLQDHIKRRLKLGDLLNAHRIWLAMYEAISGIENPEEFDVSIPDEYSSYLRLEWLKTSDLVLASLSREILGPGMVRQLMTLFCDRWSYYESTDERRSPAIAYQVSDFEAWMILLSADHLSATFLKHRVEAYGWKLPRLEAALTRMRA
ncbi:MAG: hypothetical protein NWR72_18155 [Bacteroidia bacterium]|nr:hypothetical protein [Bacteroidia bacterium]